MKNSLKALNIYRENIEQIKGRSFQKNKLNIPVNVFWGQKDHTLVVECGKGCQNYTTGDFNFHPLPGSHWACFEKPDKLIEALLLSD